MLIKSVILFLVVMAAIAMIGNAVRPGFIAKKLNGRFAAVHAILNSRLCKYIMGKR
jgi:hypothetical protein